MAPFIHLLRASRTWMIRILFLTLFTTGVQAQVLLDSTALAAEPIYTNLAEALKEPEKVLRLNLSKQKLDSLPPEIVKLTHLQHLDISRNRLKELPDLIASFPALQQLDVSKNALADVSPQLGRLKNLKYLNLSRNKIAILPRQLGQLENLQVLDLWDNDLSTLPEEVKKLAKLQTLDLRSILISEEEQKRIKLLLPNTTIFFSPSCNCKL